MKVLEKFTSHPSEVDAIERENLQDGLQLTIYENGKHDREIAELKKIRAEYVQSVGWFPDAPDRDDTDRYDADARTFHFASYEAYDKPAVVSMRLTQIDSFESSLSWDMVENNPEMSNEVRDIMWDDNHTLIEELNKRAAEGQLWDLTRLVHPVEDRANVETLLSGLVEMIGAGINQTTKENPASNENMAWVFTITPTVKAALDFLGIQNTVLTSGKISAHDNKESYFCVAYPMHALQYVRDNPETHAFTLTHVENGLRKANAL